MTVNLVDPSLFHEFLTRSPDQSRLLQYKLSSDSQILPSCVLLHYDAHIRSSALRGAEEAIEIRDYETNQENVPSQAVTRDRVCIIESTQPQDPTNSAPFLDPNRRKHLLIESFYPEEGSGNAFDTRYREQHITDLARVTKYRLIRSPAKGENLPAGKMHWAQPSTVLRFARGWRRDASSRLSHKIDG